MKTLKDTVDGMISDDWKERLVAEIEQADIRRYKLGEVLAKMPKDDPDYPLLMSTYTHITDYISDLTTRAGCHGVEYKLPSMDEFMKETINSAPMGAPNTDSINWILLLFLLAMMNNNDGGENND